MSIMRKEDFLDNEYAVRALEMAEKLPRRNVVIDPNVVRQMEMEDRVNQYLLTLGIDVYTTDGDDELDLYRIEALMCVLRGEPIPKELESKLLEKERLHREQRMKERERQDEYLMSLGINVYATDDTEDLDLDKLEALACVMNGKRVPEELERKLRERVKQLKEEKHE